MLNRLGYPILLLNGNNLLRLENDIFSDLLFLQKVNLRQNYLYYIDQWTFKNLPSLQSLILESNNLTNLSINTFMNLPKLSTLELSGNSWHCDCQFLHFRDWILQRKILLHPAICSTPQQLRGRIWNELDANEFDCLPTIESLGLLHHSSGQIEIWCRISSQSKAHLSWIFRHPATNFSHEQDTQSTSLSPSRLISRTLKTKSRYKIKQSDVWINLSISEPGPQDNGVYICLVQNSGGSVQRNINLLLKKFSRFDSIINNHSTQLVVVMTITFIILLFLVGAYILFSCYNRRRQLMQNHNKSQEAIAYDSQGFFGQDKSLITTVNPVVKPPRRYETPSEKITNTETTELNCSLLEREIFFGKFKTSLSFIIIFLKYVFNFFKFTIKIRFLIMQFNQIFKS